VTLREKEVFLAAFTNAEEWISILAREHLHNPDDAAPRVAAAGRQLANWLRRVDRILYPSEDE
jgi:hypothetical protein